MVKMKIPTETIDATLAIKLKMFFSKSVLFLRIVSNSLTPKDSNMPRTIPKTNNRCLVEKVIFWGCISIFYLIHMNPLPEFTEDKI